MKGFAAYTILGCLIVVTTSFGTGPNLVVNGDFETGDISPATTEYTVITAPGSTALYAPATCAVGVNPKDYHSSWWTFYDHTSEQGEMLIINAACDDVDPTPNVSIVWEQTVEDVAPNTDYALSFWLRNSYDVAPASIQVYINDVAIGEPANSSAISPGIWTKVSLPWNSAADSIAKITLKDLTRKYSGDDFAIDDISLCAECMTISIDIKPGSYPNSFNINGNGVIPVAILGSETFDVTEIDVNTLSFAGLLVRVKGNGDPQCSIKDVNGDGFDDMVCQFIDDPSTWTPGEGQATLEGTLLDGTSFEGTDWINVVQ